MGSFSQRWINAKFALAVQRWLETGVSSVIMTIMAIVEMSSNGRIVVPKEIRERRKLADGAAFAVMETKSGAIIFRPINPHPKKSLREHLRGFEGLEIPEMHFRSKPSR